MSDGHEDGTDAEPEITVVGDDPSVAVVGSIHGDEPEGARAIERLLNDGLDYDRAVKYVVANPPALERGVRCIDADMNRVFPGDPDTDDLERSLAARVCEETAGYTTPHSHSTPHVRRRPPSPSFRGTTPESSNSPRASLSNTLSTNRN